MPTPSDARERVRRERTSQIAISTAITHSASAVQRAAPRLGAADRRASPGASAEPSRVARRDRSSAPLGARQRAPATCRASGRGAARRGRLLDPPDRPEMSARSSSRTTGSAVVHMLSCGSSLRATPSTTTMVFCSRQQFRPRLHVEQVGDLEQQGQQLGHRDLVCRPVEDRLADGPEGLREIVDAMTRRHVAGLEMHLGDARDSRG